MPAPVVAMPAAETTAPPAPVVIEPAPAPAPAPYVPPVGTSGAVEPAPVQKLPKTASSLPLMLLSALGAFSGAGLVHSLRRRQ
jgi:LPXTG-motif cell wall-anchored protein